MPESTEVLGTKPMHQDFDPQNPGQYTEQLAEYFNLEFFGYSEGGYPNGFTPDDFFYVGLQEVGLHSVMFWRVRGETICATVMPFEATVCLGMDYFPGEAET